MKQPSKKTPEILRVHKYRGFKINEVLNKKTNRHEFKVRFQINNKEIYLTDERRKHLEETIDETLMQERRAKYDLPTVKFYPTAAEVFTAHAPRIGKAHQRKLFERVSKTLLSILPENIKINELKKAHFQKYIDLRLSETGKQSGQPISPQTVNRELTTIAAALTAAAVHFAELEDYQKPVLPKAKVKNGARTRTVQPETELYLILNELRSPRSGKQTEVHEAHRRRLADELEFRFETGLRRKEVARLEASQYFPSEKALRSVKRWKTDSTSDYIPLSDRAAEIVENRLAAGGRFIFTPDGEPRESDYRTLKTVCEKLKINYGRYRTNGFVAHDFRRNFASRIIETSDIKTASELLGHSTIKNTGIYLQTSEKRLSDAVRRLRDPDLKNRIAGIYKSVKRGKMKLKDFIKEIEKIAEK